ncbi:MAG TPA: hypothetical protein VI142_01505 [Gaiellaceae bacterium]
MRVGVVLVLALLLATPAASAGGGSFWSVGKVLRRLDNAVVQVGRRKVRVDSATALCAGYGKSVRRERVRRWQHFNCTYTTFTRVLVDKDLDFRLHVRDRTRFTVSDARWVRGALPSG